MQSLSPFIFPPFKKLYHIYIAKAHRHCTLPSLPCSVVTIYFMFITKPYVHVSLVSLVVWSLFSNRFIRKDSWAQYFLNSFLLITIWTFHTWKSVLLDIKILDSHFLFISISNILVHFLLSYCVGKGIFIINHFLFLLRCPQDFFLVLKSSNLWVWY